MKRKQTKYHPCGVVTIEAALVLPILILITLAGLQYGWLFLKYQEITNVARHAVRYATRPDVSFADAEGNITTLMTSLDLNQYILVNDVDWVPEAPDYDPAGPVGNALYAQVSIDAAAVDIINFFPVPQKLTAVATMSKEGP